MLVSEVPDQPGNNHPLPVHLLQGEPVGQAGQGGAEVGDVFIEERLNIFQKKKTTISQVILLRNLEPETGHVRRGKPPRALHILIPLRGKV